VGGINVLLVDDHTIVREGLRSLISEYNYIKVIGEANDVFEMLNLLKSIKPDIIVLDISLPGVNGLDAIKKIFRINPNVKIIILSMYSDKEFIYRSLKLGAKGYLVKKNAAKDLIAAIEAVQRGEVYLSPTILPEIVENYLKVADYFIIGENILNKLTLREKQIFYLLAQGNKNNVIAKKLHISTRTVESHRYNIMKKMGIKNVAELIKLAFKSGVVE
jgi:DNA-binding NarL/FixJ family response regulator